MLQFPEDLEKKNACVQSIKRDVQAFYMEKNKSFLDEKILQTKHCLEIVLSGSCTVTSSVDVQKLEKNAIQFRKRGNYIVENTEDYSSIVYYFENPFILSFLKEHVISYSKEIIHAEVSPFTFQILPFILSNVHETINVIKSNREYRGCITKFSLHQILLQILDRSKDKKYVSFLKYLVNNKKLDLPYYMETNFTKNSNLETLAKQTGRSLSAFKTDFKKEFNTSPMKWLIHRRLTYANYLIRTTEGAISDIAYQSGFKNISHFSRVYKEKYSCSPVKTRE